MQYRTKRATVEAIQYREGEQEAALAFDRRVQWGPKPWFHDSTSFLMAQTARGLVEVLPGRLIVRTQDGTLYVAEAARFFAVFAPDIATRYRPLSDGSKEAAMIRIEVAEAADRTWGYRLRYPGGGGPGGGWYTDERAAWRAAAEHLATLVPDQGKTQLVCDRCCDEGN